MNILDVIKRHKEEGIPESLKTDSKESRKKYMKEYFQKNKETAYKKRKEWCKNNPDWIKAYNKKNNENGMSKISYRKNYAKRVEEARKYGQQKRDAITKILES